MHLSCIISVLLVFGFPFIMTEVVDSFKKCKEFFLYKQPPEIPDILVNSILKDQNNGYKLICQRYKKAYRFATLYDTTKRIPVFSAYKYTGKGTSNRPDMKWMIETGLDPPVPEMTVPGPSVHQAINEDYHNNKIGVNRGHLFPSSHAADKLTAESTFTLTNVVPQKITFNGGSWRRIEDKIMKAMNEYCLKNKDNNEAYVLTGAIPGDDKLKERVNIPSYMWTAFCCSRNTNSWVSQTYWAENVEEDPKIQKPIIQRTLQELQKFLTENWKGNVKLFNDKCLKSDQPADSSRRIQKIA